MALSKTHTKTDNQGTLPLQPNAHKKQRLFHGFDGDLLKVSSILSSPIINCIDKKIDSECTELVNISLHSVCESFNVPMTMVGRFLRPEEARTFVSCNICAHRLNMLWTTMIDMMAHLYTSTMVVQENSFDIPRMYPTVSPLVYISPSVVLCKLSAKQLYKQVVETTFQIDQTLERLNEDKKAMTTFEETNHFLISQLVRYCVELERGSTLNQNMKTVLIKEREFISRFQKMIIKRLNFIQSGLDWKIIGTKESYTDLLDFSASILDVSKEFDIEIISGKSPSENTIYPLKNQELELSNSSGGSCASAIIGSSNNSKHNKDLMDEDNIQLSEREIAHIPPTNSNTEKSEPFVYERTNLTPSSPPVNFPMSSMSQPKSTPILRSDPNPHFRDDISFTDGVSNFVQEDASLLMKNAASNITPIIKKPANPKKSILKQVKTVQKRPSSPLVDGFDSEEEPLISVHTSTFSSLNGKEHETVMDSDSDDMSDDLSTFDDITRNLGIHPSKKQKL